jgi:hypothetical protein
MTDSTQYDPGHVAYLLRWARVRWQVDNSQPRDLDNLLERAAHTLDLTVSAHWRIAAVVEAVALVAILMWIRLIV